MFYFKHSMAASKTYKNTVHEATCKIHLDHALFNTWSYWLVYKGLYQLASPEIIFLLIFRKINRRKYKPNTVYIFFINKAFRRMQKRKITEI